MIDNLALLLSDTFNQTDLYEHKIWIWIQIQKNPEKCLKHIRVAHTRLQLRRVKGE